MATLLMLTACGGGDEGRPSLPAATVTELDAVLQAVPRDGIAPGAAMAVDHPAYQRWSGAAGLASVETRSALTAEHRHRAGSMLKTAVAIAVLQLVEQSRLSLAATLDQVLAPAFAAQLPQAQAITVGMLLSHTSGIPDCCADDFDPLVSADPQRVWSVADYLARANARPRTSAPGTSWSYSNTNYILLGEVLARATGQPWRQLVSERVFKRAGLARSDLPATGNIRCPGCSRGYDMVDGRLVDMTEIDSSMADAAGGHAWITTPVDLTRLMRALFEGRLFERPSTLEQMLTFTAAPVPEEYITGYGLGITRLEREGRVYLGHFGGTAGFLNFMLFQPATGVAISGYINTRGDLAALLVPLLDAIEHVPRRAPGSAAGIDTTKTQAILVAPS